MNRWAQFILGISPAALIRGVRHGPIEAYRSARRGYSAAAPFALPDLPEIPLDRVLGARRFQLRLNVMSYEDGMMPLYDALPLLSILALEDPKEVLEIGTFMGHTARAMAETLDSAVIHTVDLPEDFAGDKPGSGSIPKDDFHLIAKRRVGREFKDAPFANRVIQHFGDTAELDFSALGKPTFFFIDGSHTYEYCKNDTDKCLAISSPGATFLWHDCDRNHRGVMRCLLEWRAMGRDVVRIAGSSLGYWKRP
jgi:hypothetical protein